LACNVVRGKKAMKEKIREAQRVFKGYIEYEPRERCLYFYSFQLLGWALLFCLIH